MKENKDGIIIIVVIFIIVGLGWDSFKSGAPGNNFSQGTLGSSLGIEESDSKSTAERIQEAENTIEDIGKKIEESGRSSYYGKIYLSYPTALNDPDPSREYFTLTTNLSKGEYLDISGWYLKSPMTGNSATIGKAATLPFPYVKGSENIVLKQGDRAYIVKGFSPINTSFRTNKCTGYFGQNRTFSPYISTQCPSARDEDLPTFDTDWERDQVCRDYIDRLPRCTVPTNLNRLPDETREKLSSGCKTYLETKISYNTCVANYKYDTDFIGNEWYIYLERFGPLWRSRRDTIQLRDREGFVVAEVKITY